MVSSTRLGAPVRHALDFLDDVPQVEESEPLRSRSSLKQMAEEEGAGWVRSGGPRCTRRGGRGWGWGCGAWEGWGLLTALPILLRFKEDRKHMR